MNIEIKNNAHRLIGALRRTDDEHGLRQLAKILRYNEKQLPKDIIDLKNYVNYKENDVKPDVVEISTREAISLLNYTEQKSCRTKSHS